MFLSRPSCTCLLFLLEVLVLGLFSSQASVVLAARGSKVEYLPGFQPEGPLPFYLETGYIGVGESEDVQLFYYFVKSESNHNVDPVLFWISGGPGCSSFFALTQEFGPLSFDKPKNNRTLPTLSLNRYSWTKVASCIFLDLPLGTGFSYSKTSKSNRSNSEQAADHGAEFLRKWLVDHSEYQSNSFYVGGDSFSGLLIPIVVQTISQGIEERLKPHVNLKGYMIGNGMAVLGNQHDYMFPLAVGLGLISDELYKELLRDCYNKSESRNALFYSKCDGESIRVLETVELNFVENSLSTSCEGLEEADDNSSENSTSVTKKFHGFNAHAIHPYIRCKGRSVAFRWANDDSVQVALHVRKGTITEWVQCRDRHLLQYDFNVNDTRPYHANLSTKGFRSLIYSGDHDLLEPSLSSEAWIEALNYSIVENWRPWFLNGQTVGYTMTFSNNMTFSKIKGSGHIAPVYTPLECLLMFKRWISYEPL